MAMNKRQLALFIVFVVVLGMFIYKDSLDGAFIWDDNAFIKDNRYIRDASYVPKIFSQPTGSGAKIEGCFYRPLQETSYLFDYSLWGFNQRGYHRTNVLLHICTALALFWFVAVVFRDHLIAALTSILFLVHPIHTEAVCYLSGRGDLLSLVFMLLSLVWYIKYVDTKQGILLIACVVSFGASLFSKENSIILPALLLLYHYTFRKRIRYEAFIAMLAVLGAYMGVRFSVLSAVAPRIAVLSNLIERVPGFFVAFFQYVRLLLVPLHLHMEYGKPVFALSDYRVIAGMLSVLIVLFFGVRKGRANQLLFFSVGWYCVALAPVANLYPVAFFMAEHYLYFPSIGFFLMAAGMVAYVKRRYPVRMVVNVFVMGMIAVYSFLTVRQNAYWKDPVIFYTRTLRYAPQSKRVLLFLAQEFHNRRDYEQAIEAYQRILWIDPLDKIAHHDLGMLYILTQQYEKARQSLEKALSIDAQYAAACNGLGFLFTETGRLDEAIEAFNKAIVIDPSFEKAYYNLGVVYFFKGDYGAARRFYQKALALNPEYGLARNGLAYLNQQGGRRKE